ncbi:MAG TPA: zinc ribbon domain-containing protein [Pyrinomonadaceae bacterium]|nr:zinc ribbon domain-containing protein [Pyrinomonadaceae bacterium]
MYCPQCGTESSSGLQYCRSCGANLKVIGKAVTLSEAIARSDRGPLPKIKEMMKNLNVDHVSEDISRALDQMNKEIVLSSEEQPPTKPWWLGKRKTAEQRREKHYTTGAISFFGGLGFATFLYFLSQALVLKLPPNFIAQVPFEIDPVLRVIWLIGLLPVMSGIGHLIAGLLVRPDPPYWAQRVEPESEVKVREVQERAAPEYVGPVSVTERTTNLLEHDARKTS